MKQGILNFNLGAALVLTFALGFTLAGCTNGTRGGSSANASKAGGFQTTSAIVTPKSETYKISVATISADSGTGSSTNFTTIILFDAANSGPNIGDHCTIGGGSSAKPCECTYSWTELNATSGTSVSIARTTTRPFSSIQPAKVECPAPEVFGTEIIAGTQIRIKLVASAGNTDLFDAGSYLYTKGGSDTNSDFLTAQGQALNKIMRYSCYEEFQKGLSVKNRFFTASQTFTTGATSTTPTARVPLGTQFCLRPASQDASAPSADPNCDEPEFGYSAQSAYYSLYTRESDLGLISPYNKRYVCPKVRQIVRPGGPSGPGGNSEPNYFPLDTTFALAATQSDYFKVGVDAFARLSNGDQNSVGSSCVGNLASGNSSDSGSFVRSCLGFASLPNPDGSCGSFKDSKGADLPTYRLRRFVALYPTVFNTNGYPIEGQSQATDTVYVLDRPVTPPAGVPPGTRFSMQGPKPCPFAYFDRQGVTGGRRYASTLADAWMNTNIDGTSFPSTDTYTDQSKTCRTTFPLLNRDHTKLALMTPWLDAMPNGTGGTTTAQLTVYVRGVDAWSPHYEEDKNFRACAPQSNSPTDKPHDPPLHFAKSSDADSSGNISWCAEIYPTQNENLNALVATLSPAVLPTFQNFTSHVTKGTKSGANCVAQPLTATSSPALPAGYPSTGLATHPAVAWDGTTMNYTCDRSVVSSPADNFAAFPLLATPLWTENTLNRDSSYQCSITYDGKPPASSKVGKASPTQGCCGAAVLMKTGALSPGETAYYSAHLENNEPCQVPAY